MLRIVKIFLKIKIKVKFGQTIGYNINIIKKHKKKLNWEVENGR